MDNKIKDVFKAPLNIMNPVLVQVLGICSALAVTSQLKPALVMGLAVTVITYRRTARRRGCSGDHCEPGAQGFRI